MTEQLVDLNLAEIVAPILANLRLDQPAYAGLVNLEHLCRLGQVELAGLTTLPANFSFEALAWRLISQQLYQGCITNQPAIHNLAYQWLGGFLYRQVWHKLSPNTALAQEIINACLLTIFQQLSANQLHSPAAFLNWAKQIARRAVATHYRTQAQIQNGSLVSLSEVAQDQLAPANFPKNGFSSENKTETANPEKLILNQEKRHLVWQRIAQMKTTTKRAKSYQYILWATYFLDLTDQAIAQALNLETEEIYKRRFQALKILRRDQKWFEDLGSS